MKKYGVVKEGLTPKENDKKQENEKGASAATLDGDFRKRAADAAQGALKK